MARIRHRPVIVALAVFCLAFSTLSFGQAAGKPIYCWSNEHGATTCGDAVPPRAARKERRVIDAQGREIQRLQRQATAEEVRAEQERAAAQARRRELAQEQERYDQYLKQTYASLDEVLQTRDDRLRILDNRLRLTEGALEDVAATLSKLRGQLAEGESQSPAQTRHRIQQFEQALSANAGAVATIGVEREKICAQFKREVRRYRSLFGLPANGEENCPSRALLQAAENDFQAGLNP